MRQIPLRVSVSVAVLGMLVCLGGLSFWAVSRVKYKARLFREKTMSQLAHSAALNSLQAERYARLLLLVNTNDPAQRAAYRREWESYRSQIETTLKEYEYALTEDPQTSRQEIAAFLKTRNHYRMIVTEIIAAVDAGRLDVARQLTDGALSPVYQRYSEAGDRLVAADVALGKLRAKQIEKACVAMQYFTVCFCLAGFVIGVLISFGVILAMPHGPM